MQRNGVLGVKGIAAAQGNGDGQMAFLGALENKLVPFQETLFGQPKIAELIVFVGVNTGLVKNQVGLELIHDLGQVAVEMVQIELVANAVGQVDVQVAALFFRVKMLLMDGEGENRIVVLEDTGCAISLMQIAVDDHGFLDAVLGLGISDGDGQVVEVTESLGFFGEGMVESSSDVDSCALLDGQGGCLDGAAGEEEEELNDLRSQWEFRIFGSWGQAAVLEIFKVGLGVDAEDLFARGWRGFDKGSLGDLGLAECVGNALIFNDREDVRTVIGKIAWRIDKVHVQEWIRDGLVF